MDKDKQREAKPGALCCFAMCERPALMRVRTRTGWATVCNEHELVLAQRGADDWMRAAGLERKPGESAKEWRARTLAWLKANAENRKRVKGFRNAGELPRSREPGDDDEEVAA